MNQAILSNHYSLNNIYILPEIQNAKHHFRQRHHGIDQHIIIYCIEGKGEAEIDKKKYQL